jgi:hypothetical protein
MRAVGGEPLPAALNVALLCRPAPALERGQVTALHNDLVLA